MDTPRYSSTKNHRALSHYINISLRPNIDHLRAVDANHIGLTTLVAW